MKKSFTPFAAIVTAAFFLFSCNTSDKNKEADMKEPRLKEENIVYTADNVAMNGYVVYDENIDGPRPGVLVVHEWWGQNDYTRRRAKELAALGYIAFAVDFYGNGIQADNPDAAGKLATPFYQNPQLARQRFDAALEKLKAYPQADANNIGAIGYCFGGTQVLNMAKLGDDLKAVVSFHGGLQTVPADKDLLKAEILVCHGAADPFVPQEQVDEFRKGLDSIGAKYIFKAYEGATHAFSNPDATENGKKFNLPIAYNAAADTASWNEMKIFFERVFK